MLIILVFVDSQMLKDTLLDPSFSTRSLAEKTAGLSGSDLKEICGNAAMVPVREYMRQTGGDRELLEKGRLEVSSFLRMFLEFSNLSFCQGFKIRALRLDDFFATDAAMTHTVPALSEQPASVKQEGLDPNLGLD